MVDRAKLIKKIHEKFPRIRYPQDYANILIRGWDLKAIDRPSAVRSREFTKISKIKPHAFSKCHKELDLLKKIEKADHVVSPLSEREQVVFDFAKAQKILNIEKSLLLEHIEDSDKVHKIACKTLKIKIDSTIGKIKGILNTGNIFKQGSTYEKIFNSLKDNKVRSTGYLWFGNRPIPMPKYHLSRSGITLLRNISRGVK